MRYLKPKRHPAIAMYVISHFVTDEFSPVRPTGANRTDETSITERRLFLGYFDTSITVEEVQTAIEDNRLTPMMVASNWNGEKPHVSSHREFIQEGIIFENVDEFVKYSKYGIRYDDLMEGYDMAQALEDFSI